MELSQTRSSSSLRRWFSRYRSSLRRPARSRKRDYSSSRPQVRRKRIIPKEDVPRLKRIDGLVRLAGHEPNGSLILTYIGTRDEVVTQESMRAFHKALGGKRKDFHQVDSGHAIPADFYEAQVIEFFKKNM